MVNSNSHLDERRLTVQVLFRKPYKNPAKKPEFYMVREKGLEPSRLAALAPKASVSTNSTTRAIELFYQERPLK
jgi:hypothetical protein